MWRRIRGFCQRQWALTADSEKKKIRQKVLLSGLTFAGSAYTLWNTLNLTDLFYQILLHYLPPFVNAAKENIVKVSISAITFTGSIYLFFKAVNKTLTKTLSWESVRLSNPSNIVLSTKYQDSGYGITNKSPIIDRYAYSPVINEKLMKSSSILCIKNQAMWTLHGTARELLPVAIMDAQQRGVTVFDDVKIRMQTDLLLENDELPKQIEFQKTTYFNGLATNDMSFVEVYERRQQHDPSGAPFKAKIYDGLHLFSEPLGIDAVRKLNPLLGSACSNHIGTSTLAITIDGHLLITGQSSRNAQSPSLWGPSGSGSADWKDIAKTDNLISLVRTIANRELSEECGLDPKLDIHTIIIGFARDLKRGGKPEFFCISFLPMRSADLHLKHKDDERYFTTFNVYERLESKIDFRLSNLADSIEAFRELNKSKMSPPLAMSLELLVDAISFNDSSVADVISRLDL